VSIRQTALTLIVRLSVSINETVCEFFYRARDQKIKMAPKPFDVRLPLLYIDFEQHIGPACGFPESAAVVAHTSCRDSCVFQ